VPIVYGLHVPNAPNLILPAAFGGVGSETVRAIESLRVISRWKPEVIVVATPHWVSERGFRVQAGERPRQIYDFSGFPPQLSQVRYRPSGDPALARHLVAEGKRRGISVEATTDWGLDHGAWSPLLHIAPGATVPVVPLSISTSSSGSHMAWGSAIRAALETSPLRAVFVSTGSITHAFRRMHPNPAARWTLGEQIEKSIVDLLVARRYSELVHFDPEQLRTIEPEGDLGPLFMLLGAAGDGLIPRLVATGQIFGAFGMSVIEFAPPAPVVTTAKPTPAPRTRERRSARSRPARSPSPGSGRSWVAGR